MVLVGSEAGHGYSVSHNLSLNSASFPVQDIPSMIDMHLGA